ncbi:hypothetical protein [Nocardia blacklockiae]|uniref:hypothetical protein n=1 Tax=Nocardia blacklockiae TaxID=480036 RepID=UPI001895D312|nr:hypothetical protein [Nocardia blacklockiae]MBF6175134.1 hypothetical protein [Nocardia blacklockiae]
MIQMSSACASIPVVYPVARLTFSPRPALRAGYTLHPASKPRGSFRDQSQRRTVAGCSGQDAGRFRGGAVSWAEVLKSPVAIGYLNKDVSGFRQSADEERIRSHARRSGYNLVKTVVFSSRTDRPMRRLVTVVERLGVEAVFVPDLRHLDGSGIPRILREIATVITVDPDRAYHRSRRKQCPDIRRNPSRSVDAGRVNDRQLRPVTDPVTRRVQELAARAGRAGYRLVRGWAAPYAWQLLDAEDDEPIHTAATLDLIERILDE